jgi:DNA mismatch repair protein MutS
LEKTDGRKGVRNEALDELPLFALTRPPEPAPAAPSLVETALEEMSPDEMSPRAALDALYRLKALHRSKGKPER